MFKEKLGICLYGELTKEAFEVSNEKLTKDLIWESDNESGNESDNESNKKSDNESIEEIK